MQKVLPSILMVTHGLGLEGAPRSFATVAKGLAATQLWRIVVLSHADGPLRAELECSGISVLIAPCCEKPSTLHEGFIGLEQYCRENMQFMDFSSRTAWEGALKTLAENLHSEIGFLPDLILTNTILGFWAVNLARLWNVPVVWCIHESEPPFSHLEWLQPDIFQMLPSMFANTSAVVFVSLATQDVFLKAGHTCNSVVIPNCLSPDMPVFLARTLDRDKVRKKLYIPKDVLCILALGSVFERKAQTDLCQALALLPKNLLKCFVCHIVGDRPATPYSQVLHECVKRLPSEVQARIRIFVETQDTASHYGSADIFVLCSRMESYPIVILEAMSLGLPIVTTPVFGIREQLTEESSLFYEPGDVRALAEHLEALVASTDKRKALGRAALNRYVTLPGHDAMIRSYHNLCVSLVASHPPEFSTI